MVREVCFATQNYTSLEVGATYFLFVDHTDDAENKLQFKVHWWDNALLVNMQPSMAESSQLLYIDSDPCHMDCLMPEAELEGLEVLIASLWSESHPMVE